jgi:hypothetical protein
MDAADGQGRHRRFVGGQWGQHVDVYLV